jgi:hypothetical protein
MHLERKSPSANRWMGRPKPIARRSYFKDHNNMNMTHHEFNLRGVSCLIMSAAGFDPFNQCLAKQRSSGLKSHCTAIIPRLHPNRRSSGSLPSKTANYAELQQLFVKVHEIKIRTHNPKVLGSNPSPATRR